MCIEDQACAHCHNAFGQVYGPASESSPEAKLLINKPKELMNKWPTPPPSNSLNQAIGRRTETQLRWTDLYPVGSNEQDAVCLNILIRLNYILVTRLGGSHAKLETGAWLFLIELTLLWTRINYWFSAFPWQWMEITFGLIMILNHTLHWVMKWTN